MKVKNALNYLIILAIATTISCSSKQQIQKEVIVEKNYVISDPGAVEFVWEPPLINVVEVPPGLDPEGHYYRPHHQEIVEIKPGRWQYYQQKK